MDSKENYIEGMRVHHQDMEKTTDKEYGEIEKQLNAHITAWANIFGMTARTKHSFVATNNMVSPLYGLRKDHKSAEDVIKGPPLRPVCGAVVGNNRRISHFLSTILRPVIAFSPDVCDSTDDMLSRVERCNGEDLSTCVLGSMDVEALYPSIDVAFAVDRCTELIRESQIKFTNVDADELGLFLMFNDTEENLIEIDILKYCPKRNSNKGRPPKFSAVSLVPNDSQRWRG